MADDRKRILDMLAEGKITAEEAARLLDALGGATERTTTTVAGVKARPRFMCIHVEGGDGEDSGHVDVRIPLALIRAGMKIQHLLPNHAKDRVQAKMQAQGIDFDLDQLDPKKIDDLVDALTEMSIDIAGQDGTAGGTVRLYFE